MIISYKCFHDYYGDPGVKEICHAVKSENKEAREVAINAMALYLYNMICEQKFLIKEDLIFVPIPQHTGKAEYTLKIAERLKELFDRSNCDISTYVLDILKCQPHKAIYELKKEENYNNLKFSYHYSCDWSDVDYLMKNSIIKNFNSFPKKFLLLDNVIGTGYTMLGARRNLADSIKTQLEENDISIPSSLDTEEFAKPLVYAVDTTVLSISAARKLNLIL